MWVINDEDTKIINVTNNQVINVSGYANYNTVRHHIHEKGFWSASVEINTPPGINKVIKLQGANSWSQSLKPSFTHEINKYINSDAFNNKYRKQRLSLLVN